MHLHSTAIHCLLDLIRSSCVLRPASSAERPRILEVPNLVHQAHARRTIAAAWQRRQKAIQQALKRILHLDRGGGGSPVKSLYRLSRNVIMMCAIRTRWRAGRSRTPSHNPYFSRASHGVMGSLLAAVLASLCWQYLYPAPMKGSPTDFAHDVQHASSLLLAQCNRSSGSGTHCCCLTAWQSKKRMRI